MAKTKDGMQIIKGRPKSGRVWKASKKKFSSMKKDKPFNTSWSTKMKLKQEMKLTKAQDRELKDAKRQEQEDKKKRREEQQKRRLENERRAEIVQVITNTSKLKRMKKSQLKTIQKR